MTWVGDCVGGWLGRSAEPHPREGVVGKVGSPPEEGFFGVKRQNVNFWREAPNIFLIPMGPPAPRRGGLVSSGVYVFYAF